MDSIHSQELKELLLDTLTAQGFALEKDQLVPPDLSSKQNIRQLYANQRREKIRAASQWFSGHEDKLLSFFADGSEIVPEQIQPHLKLVDKSSDVKLFRYATLLWSIPVSSGYGRRMRFLVFDEANGKLIGLFALGDPVYNLRVRDRWIGWGVESKTNRLYHIMDIFVLGAVPPYSYLLCGKLVAMLAASDEVREVFAAKYRGRKSIIRGIIREPHLVLLTTTSAFGRSSLYNRITFNGRKLYISCGYTEGWGHFHFSDGTFELMKKYLQAQGDPIVNQYRYGGGPNWRLRVAKRCLIQLGLSSNLLRHGVKREVFIVPLAHNARRFLRGEDSKPIYYKMPASQLVTYFRERWLLPRADRDQRYKAVKRENLRVSRLLDRG